MSGFSEEQGCRVRLRLSVRSILEHQQGLIDRYNIWDSRELLPKGYGSLEVLADNNVVCPSVALHDLEIACLVSVPQTSRF